MDQHDPAPGLVPPLVDPHGPTRGLHVPGTGEEVWRVRESGDLGRGELGELGGEGGWGGGAFWGGQWGGHFCCLGGECSWC